MPRIPRRAPGRRALWLSGVVVALSLLSLAEAGCKDEKGGARPTSPDPAALRAQQALIARREAILTSRNKTQEERKRVQEEMQKVVQSGGDTTEMQNKLDELDSQLAVQNDQLADELAAMTSKLNILATATDQSAGIATREAELGGREDRLAQREARIAEREARMAEREREVLKGCVAPAPVIVQAPAPAPAKGGNYTRKEIDASLSRARTIMGKRGILNSDLPAHAQGLEREATSALADGEMGKAYLAATQLASTVDAVKIDGPFVRAKIARLQSRIKAKGGKLDEATNKSMGAGIADVMQKFGDGDYVRANSKLNQLSTALN